MRNFAKSFISAMLTAFSFAIESFTITIRRFVEEVPCSLQKLYVELSYKVQSAFDAVGSPRKPEARRNSAGGYVSSLRAFQPLEVAY